ncbi:hypothetical protein LR48_Vigan06g048900 [Vigna angularis]|uniref:Uncharacterized protein n=1 Tax=Phaseolus angularis TaxID=3914 RepID=A0A0L9UQZ4_PHAAN|nr:hypothetical protein LR48_Vigan06g048900 [Vigna angularis]
MSTRRERTERSGSSFNLGRRPFKLVVLEAAVSDGEESKDGERVKREEKGESFIYRALVKSFKA